MNYLINHSTLLTNLVGFWELQEASGTRYDAHTNALHLTASGTGGVGQATGKVGFGADFERADNDYLYVADNAAFPHSAEDISAFMWVKFESLVSWETFIQHSLDTGNNRSWTFYLDGTTLHFDLSTNGTAWTHDATVTWSPSTGTWYHLGFTYDVSAGEVRFYVDGSQIGSTDTTAATSYFASTARLQLGTFYDGGSTNGSFDGVMDQAGLWKKLLTSDEITDLYNSGSGMGYGITGDYFVSGGDASPGSSLSWNHTCTGDDRFLVVFGFIQNASQLITGITYNSVALTLLDSQKNGTDGEYVTLWYLNNPASGTNSIVMTASSSTFIQGRSASYNGVNQSTAIDTSAKNQANSVTTISVTPTSTVDYTWASTVVRSNGGSITNSTNYYGLDDNSIELGDSRTSLGTSGSKTITAGGPSGKMSIISALLRPVAATASTFTPRASFIM
jgi:hypothetical protein